MESTRTILVVDDDPDVIDTVVDNLAGDEYQVETASRWTEALVRIQSASPDVILLDLHLPTVQGEALLEFIRETDADLPVIIVSADIDPDEVERLGKLGASGFVRKPFETHHLLLALEQVLSSLPVAEPTEADSPDIAGPTEADPSESQPSTEPAPIAPDVSPGSGATTFQQPQQPQEGTPAPLPRPVKKRRSRKRGRNRLGSTRTRRIRNYLLILAFFIVTGLVIYTMGEHVTEGTFFFRVTD